MTPWALGEDGGDQGERRGGEHRRPHPLQRPRRDQCLRGGGRCRGDRGCGEDPEAGQEHPSPAEQVGGAATEQDQPAESERVGRDHPLEIGDRDAQVRLDGRQRDVHHRDVEDEHELRCAQQGQDHPRPAIHCGIGRWEMAVGDGLVHAAALLWLQGRWLQGRLRVGVRRHAPAGGRRVHARACPTGSASRSPWVTRMPCACRSSKNAVGSTSWSMWSTPVGTLPVCSRRATCAVTMPVA